MAVALFDFSPTPNKLSYEQIESIRVLYKAGETSMKKLAVSFKVSTQTICNIIHGAYGYYTLPGSSNEY